MLPYARFELRRSLRNRRYVFFTLGFPLVFYLLFSHIYGSVKIGSTSYPAYIMVSMAAFAALGAGIATGGSRLATERASGWVRQLRITPLSARGWLATKLACSLALVIPAVGIVLIAGVLSVNVTLSGGAWAQLVASLILGSIPFGLLGLVLGYLFDPGSAETGTRFVYIGLSVLGGLWIPIQVFPNALQDVAKALPSYWLGDLGRSALVYQAPSGAGIGALVGWTAVLAVALIWLYRRDESRVSA